MDALERRNTRPTSIKVVVVLVCAAGAGIVLCRVVTRGGADVSATQALENVRQLLERTDRAGSAKDPGPYFDRFALEADGYESRRPIEEELMTEQHRQEQRTEQAIKVRQVTDVHANWSAQERGEHGKFSYQLVLDDGAAEFVIRVTADDAKVLRDWFHDADTVYFDMEREVLIFGEIT